MSEMFSRHLLDLSFSHLFFSPVLGRKGRAFAKKGKDPDQKIGIKRPAKVTQKGSLALVYTYNSYFGRSKYEKMSQKIEKNRTFAFVCIVHLRQLDFSEPRPIQISQMPLLLLLLMMLLYFQRLVVVIVAIAAIGGRSRVPVLVIVAAIAIAATGIGGVGWCVSDKMR